MADGGILIEYGLLSGEPTPFPLFQALTRSLTVRGYVYSEIVKDPAKLAAAKAFILDGLGSRGAEADHRPDLPVRGHRRGPPLSRDPTSNWAEIVVTLD